MKTFRYSLITCLLIATWAGSVTAQPAPTDDPATARLRALASAAKGAKRDVAAQTAYGRALIEAGDLSRAERTLKAAARLAKDSPEAMYELARVRFASDDYRRARAACADLLRTHPEHVLGEVCMARAFLVWRRGSRAAEHLQAAIALQPQHPQVLLATADVRRIEGRPQEARAAYDAYLALAPDDPDAYVGLGKLQLTAGDEDAARAAFARAVKLAPYHTDALFSLGSLQQGTAAVDTLRRLLALRADYPEARVALGRALLGTEGGAAEAQAIFERALKHNRKDARAHIGLGMALLAQGHHEAAEANLKEGLAERPDFAEANLALARLYEATERFEEAFEQYRTVASKRPAECAPLLAAARLSLSLSRSVLAAAFLQKALERAPDQAEAHALLGDVLARRGDAAGARSHYQQALGGRGEIDRATVQAKLGALK